MGGQPGFHLGHVGMAVSVVLRHCGRIARLKALALPRIGRAAIAFVECCHLHGCEAQVQKQHAAGAALQ